jgi:toxin ParE1/3/4
MSELTLEWLGPASDDIAEIVQYYKTTAGVEVSRKISSRIIAEINNLVNFPYANPYARYLSLQEKGYRVLLVDNYICFYKVISKTISIYRIFHSSRNYIKLFR